MVKQTQHQLDWGKHAFPTWKLRGTCGEIAEDRQTRYSQHECIIDSWRHIWEEHPWNCEKFRASSSPRSESPALLWGLGSVSAQSHCSCSESPHHPREEEKERQLKPSGDARGNVYFELRVQVAGPSQRRKDEARGFTETKSVYKNKPAKWGILVWRSTRECRIWLTKMWMVYFLRMAYLID